jgi:hypothetical protein
VAILFEVRAQAQIFQFQMFAPNLNISVTDNFNFTASRKSDVFA